MNLESVAEALAILNPDGIENAEGNCTSCAVDAATALVRGVAPERASSEDAANIQENCPLGGDGKIESFPLGREGGVQAVWDWRTGAGTGVYLCETGDHHYNFVIDDGFYVIDSNGQFYKKIEQPSDAVDERDGYNFLYPEPDSENDSLDIWFWGGLQGNWR